MSFSLLSTHQFPQKRKRQNRIQLCDLGVNLLKRVLGMLAPVPTRSYEATQPWTFEHGAEVIAFRYHLHCNAVCPLFNRLITEMLAYRFGCSLVAYENMQQIESATTASSLNKTMRAYLKRNGMPVSGTKKQLWDRVRDFQQNPIPRTLRKRVASVQRCIGHGMRGPVAVRGGSARANAGRRRAPR